LLEERVHNLGAGENRHINERDPYAALERKNSSAYPSTSTLREQICNSSLEGSRVTNKESHNYKM
jgi:hypothetical protein